MKNLHVLPTDKPTWLHKSTLTGVLRKSSSCIDDMKQAQGMNIYITSDEEIKEGDWMIRANEQPIKVIKGFFWDFGVRYYKIILTTNQDLIKDGVQAIDDEFLEWFVKNPSCEYVEIIEQYRKCCRNTDGKNENCIEPINCEGWLSNEYEKPYKTTCEKRFEGYEIVIPKEELKQEMLEDFFNEIDNKFIRYSTEESKFWNHYRVGVFDGLKYQAERMYSEDDIREAFIAGVDKESYNGANFDEWFEQLKKK